MSRNLRPYIILAGILVVLIALFFQFGNLKQERARGVVEMSGQDDLSRLVQVENDEYRIMNSRQQLGILAVGVAIGFAYVMWRINNHKQK
ncbi:MAG: hypothetical protein AMXMBFR82_26480 [Candidatus Hydrogenedentota bacterium]